MRTIVHLSDLHFGRVDDALIEPLQRVVARIAPDLVVVSGDLTQRARSAQFRAARQFLGALPTRRLVVPGNHDVPLHNVFARALQPLSKYRRYIDDELEPFFADAEIAVAGINTARALTIKGGRINARQLMRVRERFAGVPESVTRIVVTHHPLDLAAGADSDDLVGRAGLAMDTFAQCRVDILLAGHLHRGWLGDTAARYAHDRYAAIVVQAGTATSTRGRGEPNSFNVLRIERPAVAIQAWRWHSAEAAFVASTRQEFRLDGGKWRQATA